jgi:hypothetical protein
VLGATGQVRGGGRRRRRAWPGDDCCPPAQWERTALHFALNHSHLEIAKALVEKGADVDAKSKVRMRRATPHVRE